MTHQAQLAVVRRALIDPQGATTLHKQISELTSNPRTKSLQLTPTTKEQKMLIKRLATYYQLDFVDRQRHHGFIEVIRRGKVLDPMLAELYGDAGEEMERILQKLEREAEDVAFESGWDTRASKKEKYGKRGGSGGSNGGGGKGKKHPHKARWEDFNENYDIDMVGGRKLSKKEKRAKQGRQVVKDKKERKREGRQGGSAASAEPRVVGATAVALTETNAGHRLLQKMGRR